MKKTQKNILAVAGVISTVVGLAFVIPSVFQEKYWLAFGAVLFIVGGLVMLALAFGD